MKSQQIFEATKYLVESLGVEPKAGFVANELSVKVSCLLEVSVEGRGRGTGVAIVRYRGEIVAHEFHGTCDFGEWVEFLLAQSQIAKTLDAAANAVQFA